jgi:hypothetical protein
VKREQFCEWAERHATLIGRGLLALGADAEAQAAVTELMILNAGGGRDPGIRVAHDHVLPPRSTWAQCPVSGCSQFRGHAGPHDEPL